MTWKARLQTASFGGREFKFDEVTDERQRRINIFNPVDAEPTLQALGEAARRFRVTGYFIGDDPHADMEAFAGDIRADEPRIFLHPYLGEFEAWLINFAATDRRDVGGRINFSAEFITETTTTPALTPINSPRSSAGVRKATSAAGARLADAVIGAATISRGDITGSDEVRGLIDSAAGYRVSAGEDYATTLRRVIDAAKRSDVVRLLNELARWVGADGDSTGDSTGDRVRRDVAVSLLSAVAETLGRNGLAAEFETRTAAIESETRLIEYVINELEHADTAEAEVLLGEMLVAVKQQFQTELPELPSLRTVAAGSDALRVAYRSAVGLENGVDDIMRQNTVQHPLRLPSEVRLTL